MTEKSPLKVVYHSTHGMDEIEECLSSLQLFLSYISSSDLATIRRIDYMRLELSLLDDSIAPFVVAVKESGQDKFSTLHRRSQKGRQF